MAQWVEHLTSSWSVRSSNPIKAPVVSVSKKLYFQYSGSVPGTDSSMIYLRPVC